MIKLMDAARMAAPLVADKRKHQDYDHVVELSEKYYRPLITGKVEHLMKRFNRRESEVAFAQRKLITQHITPAVTHTIAMPMRKVPGVKPVINRADFGGDPQDSDNRKLQLATNEFFDGQTVDYYMGHRLIDLSLADPNAFILLTFDTFDNRYEDPVVYPVEISSTDAWNFQYHNGILQWLLVHKDIEYVEISDVRKAALEAASGMAKAPSKAEEPKRKAGHEFYFYSADHHIKFSQVDKAMGPVTRENRVIVDAKGKPVTDWDSVNVDGSVPHFFKVDDDTLYEVRFYNQRSGIVPAFRVGCIPDQETKGRTMVNFWHSSMPWLMKSIKSVSEMDLTASLHAFPRLIQYSRRCRGTKQSPCNAGQLAGGGDCGVCGGTGFETHTSAQDHITLAMPRTKDEMFPLSDMAAYVELPEGIIKWMDGYVDKLTQKAVSATYNSDIFTRPTIANTATGELISLQSVYDALQPFAMWYANSRTTIVSVLAAYKIGRDKMMKSLNVQFRFPRNFRFETTNDILSMMKEAALGPVSQATITELNKDLLNSLYVDDPEALKRSSTIASFDPFAGKSEAAALSIIAQDITPMRSKVLWANLNRVFNLAEEQAEDFYDLSEGRQQAIIDKIVDEILAEIEATAQPVVSDRLPDGDGDDVDDGEEDTEGAPEGGSKGKAGNSDDVPPEVE